MHSLDIYTNGGLKKAYLIIPLQGCGSCIDQSIQFMKKNSENDKISYIIVDQDIKNIKIKIGSDYLTKPNLIIDEKMIAMRSSLTYASPIIYYCQDNEVIGKRIVQASKVAKEFEKLHAFINS